MQQRWWEECRCQPKVCPERPAPCTMFFYTHTHTPLSGGVNDIATGLKHQVVIFHLVVGLLEHRAIVLDVNLLLLKLISIMHFDFRPLNFRSCHMLLNLLSPWCWSNSPVAEVAVLHVNHGIPLLKLLSSMSIMVSHCWSCCPRCWSIVLLIDVVI